MKKILITILILTAISLKLSAQAYVHVKSSTPRDENSWFILYLDDKPQDAFPSDEMDVKINSPGIYTIRLSFKSKRAADLFFKVDIDEQDSSYYEVVPLNKLLKTTISIGRKIEGIIKNGNQSKYREEYAIKKINKN